MEKKQVIYYIDKTIRNRPSEVVDALNKSGVIIPDYARPDDMRNLIISEVKKGNGYLLYYLGEVITKEVPQSGERHSNALPAVLGAISSGTGILSTIGGWFGGGGDKDAEKLAQQQRYQELKQQKALQKQMKIAQSQANAQQILLDAQRQERKAKGNRTIIAVSVVGAALLIETNKTIVTIKKSKY